MEERNTSNKLNPKLIMYTALVVIFGAAFIFCASVMIRNYKMQKDAEEQFQQMGQVVTEAPTETETETETVTETEMPSVIEERGIEIPQLALDWDALKEQNSDIYSWIYVPNTNVNYPVLQHETEHDYYLEYNLDHSKGRPGCIYSQKYNTTTYDDRNTVLYGHNMKNGTMFKTLHYYEKEDFFNENRYFYIYTPESVLVYEVWAVSEFTNEHVLYKYDFTTVESLEQYMKGLQASKSKNNHMLEDVELTEDTKLVTLSTCIYGRANDRWLVVGILLGEEPMDYEAALAASTETESVE